jgi:hypothetical protein
MFAGLPTSPPHANATCGWLCVCVWLIGTGRLTHVCARRRHPVAVAGARCSPPRNARPVRSSCACFECSAWLRWLCLLQRALPNTLPRPFCVVALLLMAPAPQLPCHAGLWACADVAMLRGAPCVVALAAGLAQTPGRVLLLSCLAVPLLAAAVAACCFGTRPRQSATISVGGRWRRRVSLPARLQAAALPCLPLSQGHSECPVRQHFR